MTVKIVWITLCLLLEIYLWLKNSPTGYYFYSLFPIYFGYFIMQNFNLLLNILKGITKLDCVKIAAILVVIYLSSISFREQKNLLMTLFIVWAVLVLIMKGRNVKLSLFWVASSSPMIILLTLPYIEYTNVNMLTYGWLALTLMGFAGAVYYRKKAFWLLFSLALLTFGTGFLTIHLETTRNPRISVNETFLHYVSQISIPLAFISPIIFKRICNPTMGLFTFFIVSVTSPLFVLQSLAQEGFFLVTLFCLMISLGSLVKTDEQGNNFGKNASNSFILLFGFLVMYQISYYGMGNHGTIDAFRLEAGFRFLDQFEVAKFGLLMILKFSLPFLLFHIFLQGIIREQYPQMNTLHLVMFFISCSGSIIYFYFQIKNSDSRAPKLTISYPILSACIMTSNVLVAGYAYLITKNVKNDDSNVDGEKGYNSLDL